MLCQQNSKGCVVSVLDFYLNVSGITFWVTATYRMDSFYLKFINIIKFKKVLDKGVYSEIGASDWKPKIN